MIKQLLLVLVLLTPAQLMASYNSWGCVTEFGNTITVVEQEDGYVVMRYKNVMYNESVTLPEYDRPVESLVDVYYGEDDWRSGVIRYYRFSYTDDNSLELSWVVYDGENRGKRYQGLKIYQNKELVVLESCKFPVSDVLKGYSFEAKEADEDLSFYSTFK